jgi:hypothetical protein
LVESRRSEAVDGALCTLAESGELAITLEVLHVGNARADACAVGSGFGRALRQRAAKPPPLPLNGSSCSALRAHASALCRCPGLAAEEGSVKVSIERGRRQSSFSLRDVHLPPQPSSCAKDGLCSPSILAKTPTWFSSRWRRTAADGERSSTCVGTRLSISSPQDIEDK